MPGEMRDPTQPPASTSYDAEGKPKEGYGMRVDAIIIGKDRKVAVINGKYFQIGDKVMGVKIMDIYPQAIRVKDIAHEFTIEMAYPNLNISKRKRNPNKSNS
jgi:hypothetical protein